ncbi:hypothetical protein NYO91_11220, partial [Arhodomonas aquaeolei]|uniref:hypothetical protein n=1 Tax=Arhodomonas aquaeolei TaxID=2369 RepID=UPI0021677D6D
MDVANGEVVLTVHKDVTLPQRDLLLQTILIGIVPAALVPNVCPVILLFLEALFIPLVILGAELDGDAVVAAGAGVQRGKGRQRDDEPADTVGLGLRLALRHHPCLLFAHAHA